MAVAVSPDSLTTITPLSPNGAGARAGTAGVDLPLKLALATKGIQPPAALFVTPDDYLSINIRNSLAGVTVTVAARILTLDGDITLVQMSISPDTTRAVNTKAVPLTWGYLISAAATATGTTIPRRGQTYCTLAVGRFPVGQGYTVIPLGGDYLTQSNFVSWPYGRTINPTEGPGVIKQVSPANPAAGAEVQVQVPTGARWLLRSFRATLTTSAALGNRTPEYFVTATLAGTTIWLYVHNLGIAPSSFATVNLVPGYPNTALQQGANIDLYTPFDFILFQGWVIQTGTLGLDVADQWSGAQVTVEEWLED